MFVGHEFLAFALAGALARVRGRDPSTVRSLGVVAAVAALLPDLDVAYGLVTYAAAVAGGAPLTWDAFWVVTNGLHRVVTHPLPVLLGVSAVFAASVAGGRTYRTRRTARERRAPRSATDRGTEAAVGPRAGVVGVVGVGAAVVGAGALLWAAPAVVGWLGVAGALTLAGFAGSAALFGAVAGARTALPAPALVGAAAVGLLSHPFGDVFMAAPPPFLAPVGPELLGGRVAFAADETVNLLCVLFVEVATVWAGLVVALDSSGRRLRDAVDRRAALGVGYAAAAFVLPRPTMADAHVLGFTVVPLAAVVGLSTLLDGGGPSRPERALRAAVTGVATLTAAAGAYLLTYAFVVS